LSVSSGSKKRGGGSRNDTA